MIWFVFASALASAPALQTPYGPRDATPETYQPPAIRPFEPPSDFGREAAQGDSDPGVHRRALTQPVVVGAYVGSYETSPTDDEAAYDQGVAQREIDTDARMGPLDGRWRVRSADGEALLSLALTDRGEGRMVEGAWRRLDARTAGTDGGIAGPARTEDGVVVVPAAGGELRLRPSGAGWSGTLVQDGRSRPVVLSRAG